ncbi:MAG: twin-arginine translocase subunit TatC [Candidatus Korarchaeum sp.]|nr:twin-arginine translocase subunit TatC [Candidatus Korarchaeum sp.]MDW8035850.1 twin-arginine translocase subunit TatC [Candidatus Korarchaeum sp.]
MCPDKEAPIHEHLIELLERLRRIAIALIISSVVLSFLPDPTYLFRSSATYRPLVLSLVERVRSDMTNLNNPVVKPLASLLRIEELKLELIAYSWIDSLEVIFLLSFLLGFTFASPYIAKQIYDFVEPALEDREKRMLIPFVLGFTLLFTLGVAYTYSVIMPITVLFLSYIYILTGIKLIFSLSEFFSFIIAGLLIGGLFFTFPLIVAVVSHLGMLSPSSMRKNWRYVLFVTIIMTAIITPDPTPVSMTLLSLPFLVLYWLAYILSKRFYKE